MAIDAQKLVQNEHVFQEQMRQAKFVETLEIRRDQAEKVSTQLLEKARKSSENNFVYEKLHEASIELVNECNEIYDERIKKLPKAVDVTVKSLWSLGRFGLAFWGVAEIFLSAVPGVHIGLGTASLVYAGVEFASKSKKLASDVKTEKSDLEKAESAVRLANAGAEVGLGVLGLLLLSGNIVAPYLFGPVTIVAFFPVIVDTFFQVKNYFFAKKEIKQAHEEGEKQQSKLEDIVENCQQSKDVFDPHSVIQSVLGKLPRLFYPEKKTQVAQPMQHDKDTVSDSNVTLPVEENSMRMH